MNADDLLAGPRGRSLCWALLHRSGGDFGDAIFDALRMTVSWARYWQSPEDDDAELSRRRDELEPMAAVVADHVVTAWWASPFAPQQWALSRLRDDEEALLVLDGNRASLERGRANDVRSNASMREAAEEGHEWGSLSGTWWTTPWLCNPATTRALGERGPAGLSLVEDSLGWDRIVAWPVAPVRPPRTYEVGDAAAWRDLVVRYPLDVTDGRGPDWHRALGRRGGWLIPDWLAVAEDIDAVHVSVAGYLAAAGAVIDVDGTFATTLAGWSPDETSWLTDILSSTGEPVTWLLSNGDWVPSEQAE